VPGWGRARCALGRELRERGWRRASSPADADVLLDCAHLRDDAQRADAAARTTAFPRDDGASPESDDPADRDMPMPGGVPLAREGKARDGLDLDDRHVPLGPGLPH
jgi:hypothetical protein